MLIHWSIDKSEYFCLGLRLLTGTGHDDIEDSRTDGDEVVVGI